MKRKILVAVCLILILAFAFTMVACGDKNKDAEVEKNENQDDLGFTYQLVNADMDYSVIKYSGNEENVSIPTSFKGKPVTVIGEDAFRGNTTLKEVHIPVGIIEILAGAFENCEQLANIYIGATVTNIEVRAFKNQNTRQRNMYFDSGRGIYHYTGIDSQVYNIQKGYNNKSASDYSYVVYDNKAYLTRYKGKNENITVPSTLGGYKVVDMADVYAGYKFKSIKLNNNITRIAPHAFDKCDQLVNIKLNNNIEYIGGAAFINCKKIEDAVIPSSVKYVGDMVWMDSNPFLKIHAKFESQPKGWASYWKTKNSGVLSLEHDVLWEG